MRKKEDTLFLVFFSLIVFFVFWDVAILKVSFLKGDYLQQFFPWYSLYSKDLKALHLPLWIRQVQCGFPLFAEGQIGAVYPLNIIFFLFLPFKVAYNYSFLFHFILGAFFTYLFARRIKADFWGGMVAALLLSFGSVYAGCFINLSALKALSWFPLVLFLFEKYLEIKNKGLLVFIGLISGLQILAGSFQMTSYAVLFYILYFSYRSYAENKRLGVIIKDILVVISIAFLVSLSQLTATLQLAQYSGRSTRALGFALWNSFSPLSALGAILPYTAGIFSKGNIIYIGIMGLFFAGVAAYSLHKDKPVKALIVILLVSLALALAKFNPLYVILLKLSNFYYFRAPSRFIYFGVFSLSVLGGLGFSYFFKNKEKITQQFYRSGIGILASVIAIFLGIKLLLGVYGSFILNLAKKYVAVNIYGRPHHRYSLDSYLLRAEEFYKTLIERFSFENPYNILGLVFILLMVFFIYRLIKTNSQAGFFNRYLCFVFICFELYAFSFFSKGIRQDLADFSYIKPKEKSIFAILKADRRIFRVLPFGRPQSIPLWLRASMNAFYGLDSAAIYSPLANSDYFNKTAGLGIVDDSLGIKPPATDDLYNKIELIRHLNIKYIISAVELNSLSLVYLAQEGSIYLYEIKNYLPRLFFSAAAGIVEGVISIDKYSSGLAELSLEAPGEGLLVFSEKFYPGWRAYIDGKNTQIQRYMDILQAIRVSEGKHKIIFKYEPLYLKALLAFQVSFVILMLIIALYYLKKGTWMPI